HMDSPSIRDNDLLTQLRARRAKSLASLAAEELERMIINGELQSGDRINESALAQMFGISRGPIREACRSLEKSGLVKVVNNKGVFVREMSVAQAAEIYDVRAHLFGLAGRLAALRATDRDIAGLSTMVKEMERAKDIDAYYPLNVAFHARLVELSGNSRLAELYKTLSKELHLFRRRGLVQGESMASSNREHELLIEALRNRDADLAELEMTRHILAGKTRLLNNADAKNLKTSKKHVRKGREKE
ncbi:MAG TPA: FCD domain-containing protein, partial [Candidatus Acidoferrales bacterium]|nr:FCD domain-containing protein [Candidatus Acidoferrales bacterium]